MSKRISYRSLVGEVVPCLFVQRVLPSSSPLAQFQQTLASVVVFNFIRSEPFFSESRRGNVIIEMCFKTLEDTHVVPLSRRRLVGGVDGFAPVVEDDMILGADVAGSQVADEADGFSMYRRVSNELSATRARLPSRQFSSFRS